MHDAEDVFDGMRLPEFPADRIVPVGIAAEIQLAGITVLHVGRKSMPIPVTSIGQVDADSLKIPFLHGS